MDEDKSLETNSVFSILFSLSEHPKKIKKDIRITVNANLIFMINIFNWLIFLILQLVSKKKSIQGNEFLKYEILLFLNKKKGNKLLQVNV